ncbi:hypothetical protein NKG94_16675 [Micromonospora sp. M12]
MNDLVAAERHLRRAVAAGRRSGSPQLLAMAQMSLGYVLAAAGEPPPRTTPSVPRCRSSAGPRPGRR